MKRLLPILLALALGGGAVWWLVSYLTTGTLEITANGRQITVSQAGSDRAVKKGVDRLTVRLHAGDYEISAFSKSDSSRQIASVKAHQITRVNIGSNAAATPEPVYGREAVGLSPDGRFFLDSSIHNLVRVAASGALEVANTQVALANIKWSDSTGVAQDFSYNLFRVEGGELHPIALSFHQGKERLEYALSPDARLYVAQGSQVYRQAGDGSFEKIFTSSSSKLRLAPSIKGITVVETASHGRGDEGRITVVSTPGQRKSREGEAYELSWSPGAKYLAVAGDEGSRVMDANLKSVGQLPGANINNPTWVDDNSLLYGVGSQLWLYQVSTNHARVIAAAGANVTGISVGNGYAYFNEGDSRSAKLFRVALKSQPIKRGLLALSVFLPEEISGCGLNYANFAQPTVLIFRGGQTFEACAAAARQELDYYKIDSSQLQFREAAF